MHPTVTHVQAQLHAEELHRRAAAHRAAATAPGHRVAAHPATAALRARIGARLVRVGARLQAGANAGSSARAAATPVGDCA